ncbi:MAG: class I adenylate-forming enzyme family protein [Rubrivivax sp.]
MDDHAAAAAALDASFGTLPGLIRRHAAARPAHPALVFEGRTLSYAELDAELDRVAAALQRDGLRRGDAVVICAATSLPYALAFLGSLRAGAVVAPLAPDMTADNLARMLADADATRLFLDAAAAATLAQAAALPDVRDLPRIALDDSACGTAWSAWIAAADAGPPQPVDIAPGDAFNIIYSSGTTGAPKGIVVSHGYRWSQFQMFRGLGYGADSVALVSIPLYSNMTLSSFLPPLAMGCTVVLMGKFDARRYLELAQAHRVTHSMMVPVQFQRILALPDFDRFDLSAFRMKSCGSAPFARELKAEVLARWPGELIEYFGMTEGGGVCVLDARAHPDKLHTVGRPAPGHDLRVIDDEGRELPPGSVGEVVGRSGTMMSGYHKLPEKTREAEWFDAQGRRFIRSGDVGRFDDDGFLVLLDRRKDMIISGGFNVYPSDVEAVLRRHPAVADVAVTGVPSPQWGESPVAFVIRQPGSALDADELIAWSRGRLNKAQRLAAVDFVDELPRNGIGKVLKRSLRDRWLALGRRL